MDEFREISGCAQWSISSYKPGFGIQQLRQNDTETYWQTDGPQPHLLNLQWQKRMYISRITLYLNYAQDESYTPSKVVVKSGGYGNFQAVQTSTFHEPMGWCDIIFDEPIRTFHLQICVIHNHQNGKDTHIRQVRVFSPVGEYTEYER